MTPKVNVFQLPVHPAADVFPMLSDEELNELAADIKANGLLQPLIVKDGVLVDGRNRREACQRAGITPQVDELNGIDPVAYILSANINRRNLSKGQRAMAVAKLTPEVQHGGIRIKGKKASLENELAPKNSAVSQARTVIKWLPEIADLVMAGTKPLNEAYQEAQRLKEQADAEPKRLERLRERASDLADLVAEGRMSLPEAESAYTTRQGEERRARQAVLDVIEGLERHLDLFAEGPRRQHVIEILRNAPDEQHRVRALIRQWMINLSETEACL
jgi:hypothetical protein